MVEWLYTDKLHLKQHNDTAFTLELLRASAHHDLPTLQQRCEQDLEGSVNAGNCVSILIVADVCF